MEQPEALRLADAIDNRTHTYGDVDKAADELRRLHEENEWLMGELETMIAKQMEKFVNSRSDKLNNSTKGKK